MSQQFIENWRAQSPKIERPKLEPFPKHEGKLNILAMMSCPRLGWTETWMCISEIFTPLGIGVAKHTGVFWGQALTRLFQDAVELEADYVITLDYDSVFTRDHVLELIATIDQNPEIDAVVPVQVRRETNLSMFAVRDSEGKIHAGDISFLDLSQPTSKIMAGHFGLSIIRGSSLAKLPKPWFMAVPNSDGDWIDGQIDEDIYFWLNAEANGWEVRLANNVRIGHIQNLISWPSSDFSPRFQYMHDWNRNGAPKDL